MAAEQELLSTEIVNQGVVQGSGPDAGSLSFSVRVRRGMPDFLTSVNLKYVKLGYTILINHGYLLIAPLVVLIIGAQIGKLTWEEFQSTYNATNTTSLVGLIFLLIYLYLDLTPRSTYLVDFTCYLPPNDLKVSKLKFMELARQSGNFNDSALDFMHTVLKKSGIGEETYLPKSIFTPGHKITLKDGRQEAAMVMFGAVDDLLAATSLPIKRIKILVVNCGILNTTPSLSAMIINHYKLPHDIHSFNLGGMGCAAGVIAIDMAKDLLSAHPGSYALVVSTEATSYTWYMGEDKDMLLPNCFLRMGASAMLLSNCRLDRWRSKYELKQIVRTHKGMDNSSYQCIQKKEDAQGKQGLSVNKEILEIGGHALKANITTLGPLVLPFSEQLLFFKTLLSRTPKPYIPNYKLAFEHICILAASKKVLDELQKNLELTDEYMEASRMTLSRFGNTSSSSVWYELAYLEANNRIKKGDRIWQIAFGSGFKCNSVVWKALKSIKKPRTTPWVDDSM